MGWYKKTIYNCRKATFLIEKKNQEGISSLQQIEVRLHLMGCSVCRLYYSQSRLVDQMLRLFYTNPLEPGPGLEDAFKKGLQEDVAKELKKLSSSL